MPSKHALLSPSSSARWIACPGSVHLEKNFPDRVSDAAVEGTKAHYLAEQRLKNLPFDESEYPEEMIGHTADYYSYVIETLNEEISKCPDAFLMIEQRLDFTRWIPEGFGTADAVIVSDSTLHIIDFKYGANVEVKAKENPQMLIYASGAYERYSSLYGFDKIRLHIFQPRMGNVDSWEIEVSDLLERMKFIAERAKLAYAGSEEFCAGNHCRFCKAKALCKKRKDYLMDERLKYERETLSDQDIEELLPKIDEIVDYAKSLKEYAVQTMLEGKKYKGFKVVEGKTNRKVTDESKLVKHFEELNISIDELYSKPKLKGITTLERLAGKDKFKTLFSDCVIKPHGTPTLAEESDRRKPYETATSDFEEELKGE